MKRPGIVVLLAALLVAAAPLHASPDGPEAYVAKATALEKEGRLEAAVEVYRALIKEYPDDKEFTPQAHLRLAVCLYKAGKKDQANDWIGEALARYKGWEKIEAEANHLREKFSAAHEEEGRAVAEKLARVEADLKAKGLEGEELKRALRAEKERILAEKAGRGKEPDVDRARREFIELGMKLGIPPEETERFLEAHRRDRPREEPRPPQDEIGQHLRKMMERLEDLSRRLEKLEQAARERDR